LTVGWVTAKAFVLQKVPLQLCLCMFISLMPCLTDMPVSASRPGTRIARQQTSLSPTGQYRQSESPVCLYNVLLLMPLPLFVVRNALCFVGRLSMCAYALVDFDQTFIYSAFWSKEGQRPKSQHGQMC